MRLSDRPELLGKWFCRVTVANICKAISVLCIFLFTAKVECFPQSFIRTINVEIESDPVSDDLFHGFTWDLAHTCGAFGMWADRDRFAWNGQILPNRYAIEEKRTIGHERCCC